MLRAYRSTTTEVERRRHAAERTRGMFAHIPRGERLSDELITDRRTEAAVE